MPVIRQSKVKHVFGKANKREDCYDSIRITKSSWDSSFCSVNPKYLAIITEAAGGGSFLVLPLEKTGRVEAEAPLVAGHKAPVLDIQWSPHDDDLIASASEDCTVKVWQIPDGGIDPKEMLTEPVADLIAHQRRVGLVVWHPTAEHILLSAGADNMVFIWNVQKEEVLVEMNFPDMILSASFNNNGSLLATTCKDRLTRIINPRNGQTIREGQCHEGSKPQQCLFVKNNQIVTTGFSRMSERQLGLWKEDNLNEALAVVDLDTTNGTLFPYFDADLNLLYLCGKGDSVIRYMELTTDGDYLYMIGQYGSSDPQRGFGWMPKRGVNVNANEVGRCYRLHQKGFCEVIPFTVPRKSELFQEDLYPDTIGDQPALTAEEWEAGKDADPILISLKGGFNKTRVENTGGQKKWQKSTNKTTNVENAPPICSASHDTTNSSSSLNSSQTELLHELTANVANLQKLISDLTSRVTALESHTADV